MIAPTVTKPVWPKLRYHPVQSRLWSYGGRFAAIVAGRGSGKTEICRRKLILEMACDKPWPDPLYFYVLPTFAQAKKVAWYPILSMIPSDWIAKGGINRTELSITLINGAKLYILGADKPQRMEGVQADTVMIDESSDQRPGLFSKTVLPMLNHRNGRCYRLGVPKRHGIGRSEFREFYNRGVKCEGGVASFHWKTSEILTEEQLRQAKENTDPVDWDEQYEAIWQDVGSSVYYNFRTGNVADWVKYDPTLPICVGCDFNVDPMCWTLSHYKNEKIYTFDEVFLRDTNTAKTMDHLHEKYMQHTAGWKFYGDASGRARHTNATRSDYLIIKNDARFGEKKVFFPHKNPHIRDRFASMNLAFLNAAGEINMFISPECKHLINDFNAISYEEGTSEIEDYDGTDLKHMSDAQGYFVHSVRPIRLENTCAPEVWSTAG